MSCDVNTASPFAAVKKMATPTRRAVDYLKGTWRRLSKTPKITTRPLQISSPLPFRGRSGVCMDRTQLNDVASDDDLTIVPSNFSDYTSTTSSEHSPAIQDSDWRHFIDTPMQSSPSTFLGGWSEAWCPSSQRGRTRSNSVLTTPFTIIESVHSVDEKYINDKMEVDSIAYATPPASGTIDHSKKDSFLRYRELPEESTVGSRMSVITPTPAIRPTARSPHRRFSESVIDNTTVADLDKLMENAHVEVDASDRRPRANSADTSDKWSFISVRGESTTNDLFQYGTADLPVSKRRKVSRQEAPNRVSIPIVRGESEVQRSKTVRTHPRYSGAQSFDPRRRVLDTPHGPAVFIRPSHLMES
ncbi:hypothetical protein TruAng_008319 [Truncatella angustata]|nr:hypothetical protein TruAng_008319 [Truncatella angustata]